MNNDLIKTRFARSLKTYDKNAIVQKQMAETLLGLIDDNFKPKKILEIGSGTGLLTKLVVKNFPNSLFTTNDVVEECASFIKQIDSNIEFLAGDIYNINLQNTYDLIISNAVFQWFNNPNQILEKLSKNLEKNGLLIFSSFGEKNFYELQEIMGIGLNYKILKNPAKEELITLKFDSLLDLLKHIKYTGVNAIQEYSFSRKKLESFEKDFYNKYGEIKLTYNPIYYKY